MTVAELLNEIACGLENGALRPESEIRLTTRQLDGGLLITASPDADGDLMVEFVPGVPVGLEEGQR